jgi:hypothetical protein
LLWSERGIDKVYGKLPHERLIVDVVHTLRDAQMPETLRAFDECVLSRPPEHLFEVSADGSEPRFRPMFELLLRELAAVAATTSLPVADRHARAVEAMHLAGF